MLVQLKDCLTPGSGWIWNYVVYLVAVSAVNGAPLCPVVERRFLALITHGTQNFPCSGILDFWTFLTLSTHGTQARSSHSFDPCSDHTLSSRAIVICTCSWFLLCGRKPGPGGSSFWTQQFTPGEKCSSTWNLSEWSTFRAVWRCACLSSLVVSFVGSSYSMITICKQKKSNNFKTPEVCKEDKYEEISYVVWVWICLSHVIEFWDKRNVFQGAFPLLILTLKQQNIWNWKHLTNSHGQGHHDWEQ